MRRKTTSVASDGPIAVIRRRSPRVRGGKEKKVITNGPVKAFTTTKSSIPTSSGALTPGVKRERRISVMTTSPMGGTIWTRKGCSSAAPRQRMSARSRNESRVARDLLSDESIVLPILPNSLEPHLPFGRFFPVFVYAFFFLCLSEILLVLPKPVLPFRRL